MKIEIESAYQNVKQKIYALHLSEDDYTIVSTDTGLITMTKQERIYYEKRNFVLSVHVRSDGSVREIKPPNESKTGALRFWNTLTPDKKRLSARTEAHLIEKLFSYYGGELKDKINTFEDVFHASLEDYKIKYPSRDRSACNYEYVYNRCIDSEFAKMNLSEINSDILSVYCLKVIGTGENRMKIMYFRRNFICLLNLVFKFAFRKHMISENPVDYLDKRYLCSQCKQSIKNPIEKRHEEQEYDLILEEAIRRSKMTQFHGYYVYLYMIAVHQYLGCRPGELVALKWSDLYGGSVHFCHEQIEHKKPHTWYEYVDYTKNEKGVSRLGRSIQIIPELQSVFDHLKKTQEDLGIKSEFLFCDLSGNWIAAKSY